MIAELSAAVTGLNLLTQMGKSLFQAHTQVEREKIYGEFRETIIELHERILSAQLQMQDFLRIKVETEEKLKRYENWEVESAKYECYSPTPGVTVYTLKPEHVGEQPALWICPTCYEDRKKSILQYEETRGVFTGMRCPKCKAEFHTGEGGFPS
jgi:hypothetical protein